MGRLTLPALDPESVAKSRGSVYPEPFRSRMDVLEGEVVLVTDAGEQGLRPGDCAGSPAGTRDAHHFLNRGTVAARYLEIGSRIEGDQAFYPDDNLMQGADEKGRFAAHKDGRRY